MGMLLFIGFVVLVYTAIGIIYFQEVNKQRNWAEQINQLEVVLAKPLPSAEKLKAEYDTISHSIAPLTVPDILAKLVGFAEESGISVDPDAGKFNIPPINPQSAYRLEQVGQSNYQVLSLKNIHVQGDYEQVMAFISNLDGGNALETMMLRKVDLNQIEVGYEGEEEARIKEFLSVIEAVAAMMSDNNLIAIPYPTNYAGGAATSYMGDNPDTEETLEGFPDITTTSDEKGYTGNSTMKAGYRLFEHDKVSADNTQQFEEVSYLNTLTTNYYYTCEADGRVRQFDRPDLANATEYVIIESTKVETVAILEIDFYSKPSKNE